MQTREEFTQAAAKFLIKLVKRLGMSIDDIDWKSVDNEELRQVTCQLIEKDKNRWT